MKEDLEKRVLNALNEIRPYLHQDGGDIELISIENQTVTIKLLGSCTHCTVNQMTLKFGVEMTIKKHAPEIQQVINYTNN